MDLLYADESLVAVQKPSGLLAQPNHSDAPSVYTRVKQLLVDETGTDDPFVGLVHRLDRPTSGVMVLARTPAAARALSAQFRERTVSKTYLALVEGTLRGLGTWTDYIAKPGRQPRLVAPDHSEAKRAGLEWQVLGPAAERTLLQVRLHTGRPHQIRLQAQARGHPVVGDARYGAPDAGPPDAIALHHAIFRIDHPDRPRRQTVVAPPPDWWETWLSADQQEALRRTLNQARPPSADPTT